MEIKKDEYKLVRLNESNLADLVILYKSAFNANASLEFFKKKFDTSFTGIQHIAHLAYAKDNSVAAFYGVFPCFIEFKGKKILAAQSGDTMTHADHRGKGLFITLAKKTYELAKENGVEFVFGFPNKNSYPGFVKKLDWVHRENVRSYLFKVKTLPLIKAAKKLGINRLYRSFAMVMFRKYVSQKKFLTCSLIDAQHGGVLHDEAFLNYKTYSENLILEIDSVSIWLKLDGKLWIGDIERTSFEKFNAILQKLKTICFCLGCTEITFNLSPGSYWDILLKDHYSPKEGLPIGYLDLSGKTDISKIHFAGGDIDTF